MTLKLRAKESFTGNQTIELHPTHESEFADDAGEAIPLAELTSLTIKPLRPNTINESDELVSYFKVYPNPAKDNVTIEIQLSSMADVGIRMLDAAGREVKEITAQRFEKGNTLLTIQTKDLAEGLYMLKLSFTSNAVQKEYLQKVIIKK
jgi:hypothetical protein